MSTFITDIFTPITFLHLDLVHRNNRHINTSAKCVEPQRSRRCSNIVEDARCRHPQRDARRRRRASLHSFHMAADNKCKIIKEVRDPRLKCTSNRGQLSHVYLCQVSQHGSTKVAMCTSQQRPTACCGLSDLKRSSLPMLRRAVTLHCGDALVGC